jgi:hypothetical protein
MSYSSNGNSEEVYNPPFLCAIAFQSYPEKTSQSERKEGFASHKTAVTGFLGLGR